MSAACVSFYGGVAKFVCNVCNRESRHGEFDSQAVAEAWLEQMGFDLAAGMCRVCVPENVPEAFRNWGKKDVTHVEGRALLGVSLQELLTRVDGEHRADTDEREQAIACATRAVRAQGVRVRAHAQLMRRLRAEQRADGYRQQ